MRSLGLGIGIGRRRAFSPAQWGGATPHLWADFSDSSRLFQDTAGTVPATGPTDPVGYVRFSGLPDGVGTNGSGFPLRSSNGLSWDGVDDRLLIATTGAGLTNNAPGFSLLLGQTFSTLAGINTILGIATTAITTTRFLVSVTTTGEVSIAYRRLDGDSLTTVLSAAGVITTGVAYWVEVYADMTTGGAGALVCIVNGVTVINASIAGTGNFSATNSGRTRLGSSLVTTPTNFLSGRMAPRIAMRGNWTAPADRVAIREWVVAAA